MNKMIVVYDPETKYPTFTVSAPYPESTGAFYTGKGLSWLETDETPISDKYVVEHPGGEPTLETRPTLPATWNTTRIEADGIDEAVLSISIPSFTVYVDNVLAGEVTDGTFELSVESVGTYHVRVIADPYMPHFQTITAILPVV